MTEVQELAETLVSLVEQFGTEHEKHVGGNKAAGGRARKIIGEIKNLCTPYRKASVDVDKVKTVVKAKKK